MNVSCLLLTFNCAKRAQSSGELQYVLESVLDSAENYPDFVVLALQESASILDASLRSLDEWHAPFITAATNVANGAYSLIAEENAGAVSILVFEAGRVNVQRVVKRRTHFGMLWSSLKGAASVSLVLEGEESGNDRVTFVSTHLAANEGQVEARNRDFAILYEALGLSKLPGQLFILGDLNYRSSNSSFETDELTVQMREGKTAWGLTEAPVNFEPSFKYLIGSSDLDSKRSPSWCDRILYRPSSDVTVEAYDIFKPQTTSDHKPVFLIASTPANIPAPLDSLTVPPVSLPPAWLPRFVDRTVGSALFVGTTRTGWVIIGFTAALMLFIYSL